MYTRLGCVLLPVALAAALLVLWLILERGGSALMDTLLVGLIWLLIYALFIALVCYIIVRIVAQFFAGAASFGWVVWAIGGLILLVLALRLFAPLLGA